MVVDSLPVSLYTTKKRLLDVHVEVTLLNMKLVHPNRLE
jgi:hypothetical protein